SVFACAGKLCVLRKKSVAGMNCLSAAISGDVKHFGNIQVGLTSRRRANVVSFVRQAYVQGGTINIGKHSNRSDSQFAAGANYPYRNFTAICNEHFSEHNLDYKPLILMDSGRRIRRVHKKKAPP